jgi:hypothetical protein
LEASPGGYVRAGLQPQPYPAVTLDLDVDNVIIGIGWRSGWYPGCGRMVLWAG